MGAHWPLGDKKFNIDFGTSNQQTKSNHGKTKSKKTPFLARFAGKKNLKSLPVASQKFNIHWTVYAHKMARFQNCVMLFKMAARFPNIWALGDILVPVSWQTKSKKTPFLARFEPPTPYIIHWSRWQLFCVETALN